MKSISKIESSNADAPDVTIPGPNERPFAVRPYRVYSAETSEIPEYEANQVRLDIGLSYVSRGQVDARVMYLDDEPADLVFGTAEELAGQMEDRILNIRSMASRHGNVAPEIDFGRADFDTLSALRSYLVQDW